MARLFGHIEIQITCPRLRYYLTISIKCCEYPFPKALFCREFRFRFKVHNILAGEGYKTKSGCTNGIDSVKKNAPDASIEDLTEG
ncbi:MAG: YegP family protein [Candidatus Sedimenticola sp. (ex Thyasira tokunagai)]